MAFDGCFLCPQRNGSDTSGSATIRELKDSSRTLAVARAFQRSSITNGPRSGASLFSKVSAAKWRARSRAILPNGPLSRIKARRGS